jgi:DnaJ family protein C protein 28
MSNVPRNIDEQIRQAMQRGEFDNLPGKGKPLNLSQNPHEDPGWRITYRMLKENGYTLPWIESRRSIEIDFENDLASLQRSWEWHVAATGRRNLVFAEREWQQALQKFHQAVTRLNKRVRNYNLEIPSNQFQRRLINAELEIKKITHASD